MNHSSQVNWEKKRMQMDESEAEKRICWDGTTARARLSEGCSEATADTSAPLHSGDENFTSP
jgi:hypothetical protein